MILCKENNKKEKTQNLIFYIIVLEKANRQNGTRYEDWRLKKLYREKKKARERIPGLVKRLGFTFQEYHKFVILLFLSFNQEFNAMLFLFWCCKTKITPDSVRNQLKVESIVIIISSYPCLVHRGIKFIQCVVCFTQKIFLLKKKVQRFMMSCFFAFSFCIQFGQQGLWANGLHAGRLLVNEKIDQFKFPHTLLSSKRN